MKYVIVERNDVKHVILLSNGMPHNTVQDTEHVKIISAGFCAIYVDNTATLTVKCWGDSMSLRKVSLPDDHTIISRYLQSGEFSA
jgi:hypothetical protein